ncbi:putative prophage protein [Escherichia coli]|nr:putative prophage protein [Escherichia coli]
MTWPEAFSTVGIVMAMALALALVVYSVCRRG